MCYAGLNSEASALIQLAVMYNYALQDLYSARYEHAAEWIDLALKKFFFFRPTSVLLGVIR